MDAIVYRPAALAGLTAMQAATARSFGRHSHDCYGIGLMDQGGQRSASDRRELEQLAGQMMFVNPGEVHDGRATSLRRWRMFYVEPATLHALLDEHGAGDRMFGQAVCSDAHMAWCFEQAYQARDDALALESAMLVLLHAAHPLAMPHAPDPPAIARALAAIQEQPAHPWTLNELAVQCGLSRYQLHRAFVGATGFAPHNYVLQQRLAQARRLLMAGLPCAQAAAAAGFFDQSHFTRHFQRAFGVAPGRYC